jgi:2-oxoglutarate ferredoxin oxidoreductase subunit alpha
VKRYPIDWAASGDHDKRNQRNVVNSLYLNPNELEDHNRKLYEKYTRISNEIADVELVNMENASMAIIAYGTSSRIALAAIEIMKEKGISVGLIRLKTLWPFPYKQILEATKHVNSVLVAELSMGQLVQDVKGLLNNKVKVGFYGRAGGNIFTPEEIVEALDRLEKEPEHDYYILKDNGSD